MEEHGVHGEERKKKLVVFFFIKIEIAAFFQFVNSLTLSTFNGGFELKYLKTQKIDFLIVQYLLVCTLMSKQKLRCVQISFRSGCGSPLCGMC